MSTGIPGFFAGTEMPTAGWWEALWHDPAGVLDAVGLKAGMDVIDLCSGDGWFTLQIAKIARRVTAIDLDRNLLDLAHHRLAEAGVTNCRGSRTATPTTSPRSQANASTSYSWQTPSTAFRTGRGWHVRCTTPSSRAAGWRS